MLDPQPHINMTGSETSGKHSKTHLSLSPLTVKLVLTISLPSGHGQTGRVGTSIQTINRTICLFPRWSTSLPEAVTGQQMCNWGKKKNLKSMLLPSWEKNYEETEVCTAGDTAPWGDASTARMFEVKCEKVTEKKSCEQTTQLEINTGGKKEKKWSLLLLNHGTNIDRLSDWCVTFHPPPAHANMKIKSRIRCSHFSHSTIVSCYQIKSS